MGALRAVKVACRNAWQAGLALAAASDSLHWRSEMDHALESLRDALTLGGIAPRPTLPETRNYLMKWGVDEGLITESQYDEWKSRQ